METQDGCHTDITSKILGLNPKNPASYLLQQTARFVFYVVYAVSYRNDS